MMLRGVMEDEMLDDDGYPTKKALKAAREMPCDVDATLIVGGIKAIWHWSEYVKWDEETNILELHTGGWSGNEEIIIDIFAGNKTREKLGTLEVYVFGKDPESVVVKWISHKYLSAPCLYNEILPD